MELKNIKVEICIKKVLKILFSVIWANFKLSISFIKLVTNEILE